MTITKTTFLATGLLAVGLIALALDARSRLPAPLPRESSPRTRISAPGRIEGAGEPSRLRLGVAGRVVEVAASEGQFVEAGQVLIRIEHEPFLRELERAQADLNAASGRLRLLNDGAHQQELSQAKALYDAQLAELAQAETAFNRVRDLRVGGVATQQEFDLHRSQLQVVMSKVAAAKSRLDLLQAPPRDDEVQVARAQVDAARASVALAQFTLNQTRLTAPVAGQVLRVGPRLGELTGPQSAEPAVVMAQTGRLSVRAFVDEIDAPRVGVGQPAVITIDGLARQVRGRVARVSPSVGPKPLWTGEPGERFDSDVREIWLELAETDDLVLGLRAHVLLDASGTASRPRTESPPAVARAPTRHDGPTSGKLQR